jgi:hypothetical protein
MNLGLLRSEFGILLRGVLTFSLRRKQSMPLHYKSQWSNVTTEQARGSLKGGRCDELKGIKGEFFGGPEWTWLSEHTKCMPMHCAGHTHYIISFNAGNQGTGSYFPLHCIVRKWKHYMQVPTAASSKLVSNPHLSKYKSLFFRLVLFLIYTLARAL